MSDMLPQKLLPHPYVLTASKAETVVLLDPVRGRFFALNRVASTIWTMATEGQDLSTIVSALQNTYHVSEDLLTRDIAALIREFVGLHLAQVN